MKKLIFHSFLIMFVSACSLVGFHFKLHNPKRPGKYPELTPARKLLGDQESKYRTCYDVNYYSVVARFPTGMNEKEDIVGSVIMMATAVSDIDTIQIDLKRDMFFDGVNLVTSFQSRSGVAVIRMDSSITFLRKEDAVLIVFRDRIKAGNTFTIDMDYHGRPTEAKKPPWRGGFVRKKDDLDNPWWGVACQFEGAGIWWPSKDVVNDEADSTDIILVVPDGLTAVSNGQLVRNESDLEPGKTVFQWHVSYPINLYNVTFYIGKYKLLHDIYASNVTGDTLQLNHYVLEQHYDKAVDHFKQLKDHLAVYEEYFGPYPFYRDGFKLVESPYAGMEHQTAIAYGNKFRNNNLGFDYIILHETAHEWWGNSLTAYDLADAWLHEGFATYAECIYVEKTKGYQAYLSYIQSYKYTIINRRPLVAPYGMRYFNFRDGDIYSKGAWVLHTLRETIGKDSVFFGIIKTFATRYAYKNVTSKDFIALVNEKTGEDYNWFFNQYLHNRFVPELEYYKNNGVFYYSWNDKYSDWSFNQLKVKVATSAGQTKMVQPRRYIDTVHCTGNDEPYLVSNMLLKFTENKRLKKQFEHQKIDRRY